MNKFKVGDIVEYHALERTVAGVTTTYYYDIKRSRGGLLMNVPQKALTLITASTPPPDNNHFILPGYNLLLDRLTAAAISTIQSAVSTMWNLGDHAYYIPDDQWYKLVNKIDDDTCELEDMTTGARFSTKYHNLKTFDEVWHQKSKTSSNEGCNHEWIDYTGLSEMFTYCTKCDTKKDT